ncbi:MAG: hypothetical protein ACLTUR_16130 [Paraclostridium sordellii]
MAANIKIRANSSDFQKQMREMSTELKKVSSSYNLAQTKAKLFGSATDVLKSKQSELTSKIQIQNRMIQAQTQHMNKLNSDISKQKESQSSLSQKIEATTNKYKESVQQTGKNSEESKKLQKELKELKDEYAKNDKAIESNSKKLDSAEIKLNNSRKSLLENEKALEEVNNQLKNVRLDKFTGGLTKIGNASENLGKKMTMGITTPMVGIGMASFGLASDLNENLNKTEVVFKKNSDEVTKWSETSLEKMGMCQSSALEMASKFGDMGSSMGLSSQNTKKYSMNLTQLAADLASFKNISIDRANDALTGVYTGETEALKGLGIVMTQTNLEDFAHSQGIKKKIKDMSQAEQVQLRYNYVMSKTKDAQGDFARTGDQAANAGRTFKESIKALGATVGNDLLPIFTPWITKANSILKSLAHMDTQTRKTLLTVAGVGVVVGPVLIVIGKLIKGISNTIKVFAKLPSDIKKGIKGIKDFGSSCKKVLVSIKNFSTKIARIGWSAFTKGARIAGTGLKNLGKAFLNATKQVASFSLKLAKIVWNSFIKSAKLAGKGILSFGKGLLTVTKNLGKLTLAILKNSAQLTKNGLMWAGNKAKMLAFKGAQLAVTGATKAMTLAQKGLNLVMSMNPIGIVITALVALGAVFVTLYNKCDWFRNGVNAVWSKVKSIFVGFANFFKGAFHRDFTRTFGLLGVPLNHFFSVVGTVWNGIKGVFNGVLTFLSGVFTGNWRKIFSGLKQIIASIFGTIGGIIKAPINAAISGINSAIRAVNRISFNIPNWVPVFGGKHFGIHLPQIPALAEGGIVTKATMALVGEGKEHEAVIPLSKLDKLVTNSVQKVLDNRGNKTYEKDSKEPKLIQVVLQVGNKDMAEAIFDEFGNLISKNQRSRGIARGRA